MSDEIASPPSDGGGETSSVASTPAPAPAQTEAPATSAREALERAFDKVDGQPAGTTAKDGARTFHGNQFVGPNGEPKAGEPVKRPVPSRFAKEAHPDWDITPERVQAETERALKELTDGLEKHKGEAEKYRNDYGSFEQIIAQNRDNFARRGIMPAQAFGMLLNAQATLDANPIMGIARIAQTYGIHPMQAAQQLAALAQGQQRQPQYQQQPQFDPRRAFAPYAQEIHSLKSQLEEIQTAPIKQEIARLQSEKPFFEMLRPRMADLVTKGRAHTPAEAYDLAVAEDAQLKEAIEALNARKGQDAQQQGTPEHIREKAKLSVTGSPTSGSNPSTRKPAGSAREALQAAFSQVGLR